LRAASPGMLVSEVNCHPFQYGKFLWMHNGWLAGFMKFKRQLRRSLSDDIYNLIQGTTDSEHAFAVFLNKLVDPLADHSCGNLEECNDWNHRSIRCLGSRGRGN
jgi:predicted glutamine amidotransferase